MPTSENPPRTSGPLADSGEKGYREISSENAPGDYAARYGADLTVPEAVPSVPIPETGQSLTLTERGTNSEKAQEPIDTGATYRQHQASSSETAPEPTYTTKEQRLALGKLEWSPAERNQFTREEAERIIARGLTPQMAAEQIRQGRTAASEETAETSPMRARDEVADERGRMAKIVDDLSALVKENRRSVIEQALTNTSSSAEDRKKFVRLMEAAAEKRKAFTEKAKAHAKKSGMVPNMIRDLTLTDLYSKEEKQAEQEALRAEHEAYKIGSTLVSPEKRHELIKMLVLDPLEQKQAAREEGLSQREKGALEKSIEWYKNLPPYVRTTITAAAFSAVGAATGGGGLLPLLTGGVAAVSTLVAARMKSGPLRNTLATVGGAVTVGGATGLAVHFLTRGVHKLAGTKKKALETLAKEEGFENADDWKGFLAQAEQYRKALNAEKRIVRDATVLGSAAGFAGGFAFGQLFGGGSEAVEAKDDANVLDVPTGPDAAKAAATGETSTAASSVITAEVAPHAAVEVSISEGDYAGRALIDLKEKLAVEYKDVPADKLPPAVSTILATENVNVLTHKFGFAWGTATDGSQSFTLQPGDSIDARPDGSLVFEHGGKEHVLMNAKGEVSPLQHSEVKPVVADEVAPAAAPAAEGSAAPEVTPTPDTVTRPEERTVPPETVPATTPDMDNMSVSSAPAAEAMPAAPTARPFTPLGEITTTSPETSSVEPPSSPEAPLTSEFRYETPAIDAYTNPYGVEVNPDRAQIYNFDPVDGEHDIPAVFGGSEAEMKAAAEAYLKKHPDNFVLFDLTRTLPDGSVEHKIGAFAIDPDNGEINRVTPEATERIWGNEILSPDRFTKPLRF